MTNEIMKKAQFFQDNKSVLESFFGVSLPELDLNSSDFIDGLAKYQTIFDIYDSVAAFKEANGRGEKGLTEAFNNGMAAYIEGKIVFFNEVNYDMQNDDIMELD